MSALFQCWTWRHWLHMQSKENCFMKREVWRGNSITRPCLSDCAKCDREGRDVRVQEPGLQLVKYKKMCNNRKKNNIYIWRTYNYTRPIIARGLALHEQVKKWQACWCHMPPRNAESSSSRRYTNDITNWNWTHHLLCESKRIVIHWTHARYEFIWQAC